MIPAGLPCVTGVISKFLLLNPNRCFGKQIDASQVVPVGVADDDVRDFCGLNTGELHGFVGAKVFCRWKVLDRKSTRLNSSHPSISYAVFCLKKKKKRHVDKKPAPTRARK